MTTYTPFDTKIDMKDLFNKKDEVKKKAIRTIKTRDLNTWLKWINKELTEPLAPKVKAEPQVQYVLEAFRELILKVKYSQKEK